MKEFLKTVRWTNSMFLIGTFLTTITAVPLYIWHYGLDAFQITLFWFFLISTGLSITLGYHRLFSHLTFQARWPVKLFTLLFGAAAFEGSAIAWSADHRRHHKFVDHEEDPYDISKGLFHAHIGWLLFRTGPDTPLTWVRDLKKDRLAWWQHEYYVPIAIGMAFAVPAAIGWAWGGPVAALGAFLIAGVARVVVVHHMTFCINSLCHWIGDRPYSSDCTARDSVLMAVCTFGEGYHNFHHEFQHDYRNGVKPWQFDPTKWTIWLLSKVGLVEGLRTVPEEKILKAQIAEHERRLQAHLDQHPLTDSLHAMLENARTRLNVALERWETLLVQYREAAERRGEISRREMRALKKDVREAADQLRASIRHWVETHRSLPAPTA
ncbi:MAG: acyl-CoA desaturase [Verrucomicrobiaceae bacterium]|nr:MAG: acyl-CoA desaturase [Verrucomicrobiaceae bacterium]